jgi:hypothetical protein
MRRTASVQIDRRSLYELPQPDESHELRTEYVGG